MPVAGAIKLDISADASDKASATLRGVRSELKRNEEALQSVSAAGKENADISDILARGSRRERAGIAAEVDAREKAAKARRDAVQAAREAAAADDKGAISVDGFKGAVEGAAKGQEFLNKVLGVVGFGGIAAAAVEWLSELVSGNKKYQDALDKSEQQQGDFNARIQDMLRQGRDLDISRMDGAEAAAAKATDQLRDVSVERGRLQRQAEVEADFIKQSLAREIELREKLNSVGYRAAMDSVGKLVPLEAEHAEIVLKRLAAEIRLSQAKDGIRAGTKVQLDLEGQSNVEYQKAIANHQTMVEQSRVYGGLIEQHIQRTREMQIAQAGTTDEWREANRIANDMVSSYERIRAASGKTTQGEANARAVEITIEAARKAEERRREQAQKGAAAAARAESKRQEALRKEVEEKRKLARLEDQIANNVYEAARADMDAADRLTGLREELAIARARTDADRERLELQARIAQIERDRLAGRATDEEAGISAQIAREEARKKRDEKHLEEQGKRVERLGDYAAYAVGPLDQLTGRLGGVSDFVSKTTDVWSKYAAGQSAVGDAVAGTIGFMGGAIAQAISDKRAQAAVEGGFESAASIASFASGNVPAGIAHAAAAAAFFGVAATGGAKGAGGGAGGASASAPSNVIQGSFGGGTRARSEDTRTVVIHHYGAGIIYGTGPDVARAHYATTDSLNGTNMQAARY